MTERRTFTLKDRKTRHDVALIVNSLPLGTRVEIKDRSRSDDQNRALHGLIGQIMRQRTHHNGIRMDMRKWKGTFMHALGEDIEFIPTLDGDSVFPLSLSTRELTVARFSELLELILAWTAREGLTIKHFGSTGTEGAVVAPSTVAA